MTMRIAVASDDFRRVTGHAGKACRFLVFDVADGVAPREVERLDLPPDLSIHEFRCDGPHPLFGMRAVIAGSAGAGFVRRLAERGVAAVTTAETDPMTAVARYVAGTLAPAGAHDHDHDHGGGGGCGCTCG